jgi:hypothetical protein
MSSSGRSRKGKYVVSIFAMDRGGYEKGDKVRARIDAPGGKPNVNT